MLQYMTVHVFSNGNKITGAYSEAETKKATIKLLRTIVVLTQTLKPLPDDVMMTMKLLYYDHGIYKNFITDNIVHTLVSTTKLISLQKICPVTVLGRGVACVYLC